MLDAIFYHASVSLKNGKRGQPNDPGWGLFTEFEHKNISDLVANIKNADSYLFKNTKDVEPVGDVEATVQNEFYY